MEGLRRWRCRRTNLHVPGGSTLSASDPIREGGEAFNQACDDGGVHKAGRGNLLVSQRTGAPLARRKPTGDAGKVRVF
jgi:hypothetical protein